MLHHDPDFAVDFRGGKHLCPVGRGHPGENLCLGLRCLEIEAIGALNRPPLYDPRDRRTIDRDQMRRPRALVGESLQQRVRAVDRWKRRCG